MAKRKVNPPARERRVALEKRRTKTMITLEMLGIAPAAKPLHHAMKQAALEYESNQVVAFAGLNAILQRKRGVASAGLDIFQSKDSGMVVFIVTEPPDDIGMSISNCADNAVRVMGLGHLFMGDEKGRPVNPKMIYIEHYPESVFEEKFNIVTFTPSGMSIKNEIVEVAPATGLGTAYQATWVRLDRVQVERLIGQEFALGR
jgi:hypothetical protein